MAIEERALLLDCEGARMMGVVSTPAGRPSAAIGVVVVVGGPQYRAGSHRQFVQLARAISEDGIAAMRFDARGMGDSEGDQRSFEDLVADVGAAVDGLLASVQGLRSVVLWGLCDGASAALLYLHERKDPRIAGLVLVNPWVRTVQGQARAQVRHYYAARLRDSTFWKKLLTGRVTTHALVGLMRSVRDAAAPATRRAELDRMPYTQRMAHAWHDFEGPVLLVLSGHDLTAREFEMHVASSDDWQRALATRPAATIRLDDADHTCSQPQSNKALIDATRHWLTTTNSGLHCYDEPSSTGGIT